MNDYPITEMCEMTVLEQRRDDLYGSAVYHYEGNRFRATIKRNAYDFQSFGKVELWLKGKGWAEVQTFPISGMSIAEYSPYVPDKSWEIYMTRCLAELTYRCLTMGVDEWMNCEMCDRRVPEGDEICVTDHDGQTIYVCSTCEEDGYSENLGAS
ncbi:MAG: hypothetical protein ACO3VQ_05245 [Ilumatobacteraceae bacterium]